MELAAVNSPATALVAGFVTSLHCAGMCGPLACMLVTRRPPAHERPEDPNTVSAVYHVTRLTAYALLGAVAGGLGRLPLSYVSGSGLRWLPWLIVLYFVAVALHWDRWLRKPAVLGLLPLRLRSWARTRSRTEAAALLGFATPLLPCGPLYLLLSLALLSGSALRGVEFMLAFGFGTVPLLWLAQWRLPWIQARLSPAWLERTRVTLSLAAALVITWRLRGTFGFAGPDPASLICF